MRPAPRLLVNTPDIEIWPGGLLRARSNHAARALSRARHVLRRKRDGRYLAADLPGGLLALVPHLRREPGIDIALTMLGHLSRPPHRAGVDPDGELPLDRLQERLQERLHVLGLDGGYGERTGLPLVAEPAALAFSGFDRYRRPLWLVAPAARAWRSMHAAALHDGVVLEAVSGYRSHAYQFGIFERKLARGLGVEDILMVNAAPGYSEHHSGRALDLGTLDEPPAEDSFEHTAAFAWLRANAGAYGFAMSYPRDNPHGIVYEPWHWCFRPPQD